MYSLDTSAFYTKEEKEISRTILKLSTYKRKLSERENRPSKRIKLINALTENLKDELRKLLSQHSGIRYLDNEHLLDKNVVSSFESTLTRTLKIKDDELTDDIFIIRIYYFEVLKDLIHNGFIHNNEKYIYFSSSAGQIRTKKGVWIKESTWDKYKNTLTCGLSVQDINAKGGSNINKYLAYIALTNGATSEWKGFNIHRSIVVDDLETNVHGWVDYIDRDTYVIDRKEMDVPIEHTDGCGMILPTVSKVPFMVRLPFMKGLLVPFAFNDFAKKHGGNSKVKDIYGKEWDIFEDKIEIIFTKSQFKMWKYYENWDDYKDKFVKYHCQASKLNEASDIFPEAKLNYQMLQTLTDISDKEIEILAQKSIGDILNVGSDKDVMLRLLGVTDNNRKSNYFQQALEVYPELLNDVHAREVIKDVKKSLVKQSRSGRLRTSGKYTFLIPDLYALCEKLFLDRANPNGLLGNGEVYCDLFKEGKLDVLRSPHLYREHGIRNNTKDETKSEWFITKGIYVSIHDLISKMLQFDHDGDTALVVDDRTLIKVAERNMEGIVPLYYEMASAPQQEINPGNIYEGLIHAFKANIGIISNNISKVWNSDNLSMDVIKWQCMLNNFVIDYAKTLFMPSPPKEVEKNMSQYEKEKLPFFFVYAKDKKKSNVNEVNNSVVNRLNRIIPNRAIQFQKVAGKLNYRMLMKNKRAKVDRGIIKKYIELDRSKKWRTFGDDLETTDRLYIYKVIRRELLEVNSDIDYVVDVLVRHLYGEKNSRWKTTLWESFGDVLVRNLKRNVDGTR